jgi:hypothetical protein
VVESSVQPGFALGLLRHFKRFGGVREQLIAPLVILRLADLVVVTDGRHRFALEASSTMMALVLASHFRHFMADPSLVDRPQST